MDLRRIATLIAGGAGAAAIGATEIARAQGSSGDDGSSVSLSDTISGTVRDAVSPIATHSSSASGGSSDSSDSMTFDDSPGTSIADASGGNSNVSFAS